MSHISKFNEDVRNETIRATPNPRSIGRSVRDFYSERDAVATPRRFSTVSTPMSRRIRCEPDIAAGLEEEDNRDKLEG
jgi:hypothetical protein